MLFRSKVHIALDAPETLIGNRRMHGSYFRHGDRRFSNDVYEVDGILRNPGKNLRYKIKDMYGSYLQSELLPAS